MKILIINGPNINLLGTREKEIYGSETYDDLLKALHKECANYKIECEIFQSNHEGDLIDAIQKTDASGIIINAGAYTHTSIAIMDALLARALPVVEVHLTDPKKREKFRHFSYISLVAKMSFAGDGIKSYLKAIDFFAKSKHE